MIAYIVTEDTFDEKLLKRLLPGELLRDVFIVAAGGLSDGISMARSLAVRRQVPLLLVFDSDSVDSGLIEQRRSEIEYIVAGVSIKPIKVVMAVPQLEGVLFGDRELVQRWFGDRLTQEDLIRAEYQPRMVLERLVEGSGMSVEGLIEGLSDREVERLRSAGVIREAMVFLEQVQAVVV
jgi:hypothetical protein